MLLSVERGLDVPFGQNFPSPCPRAHNLLNITSSLGVNSRL